MRKFILGIVAILCFTVVNAQNVKFKQLPPPPPAPQILAELEAISDGDIAIADIDGDNDLDILITGYAVPFSVKPITKLYINNGAGAFLLEKNTPFPYLGRSTASFADIDSDNDKDLLINGVDINNVRHTKLYTNNGNGVFTLVTGTPFTAVSSSTINFEDIDNDNDLDVLISGYTPNNQFCELYTNDGTGNFTLVNNTPFTGFYNGAVVFGDIDGDNDKDVIVSGYNSNSSNYFNICNIFTNDGSGNFSQVSNTPFDSVARGSLSLSDIDGDTDLDLFVTGYNSVFSGGQNIADLYTNDGNGNFTLVNGSNISPVVNSSSLFVDVDNDNDKDLILFGDSNTVFPKNTVGKLYKNDGSGAFTQVWELKKGIGSGDFEMADLDNDGDLDLLFSGDTTAGSFITGTNPMPIVEIYGNDGFGSFVKAQNSPFWDISSSSVAFSDIDSDGDEDVLMTGNDKFSNGSTKLYSNDGSGNFMEVNNTNFPNISNGSIAFSDVDGDNDQDVVLTGSNISQLFLNDGNGNFTLKNSTPFTNVTSSSIAFSDIDNDNDEDLLITGYKSSGISGPLTSLYVNNGSGGFTLVNTTPFVNAYNGSVAFADIDNDNDDDLLITGNGPNFSPITQLYSNDGTGNFSLVPNTPFIDVSRSSVEFADVDGDTDLDVLITGYNNSSSPQQNANLYINDGTGNFTLAPNTPFIKTQYSSSAFTDVDNDNDLDVVISGKDASDKQRTVMYLNDGMGNFSPFQPNLPFRGVSSGSLNFSDIDGNGYSDLLITGFDSLNKPVSRLYKNLTCANYYIDNVSACKSYTWIDGNTYYANDSLSKHIFTDSSGCDSILTLNLNIFTIDTSTTQNGFTITANENGAVYQWLDCDNNYALIPGETAQFLSVTLNGKYAVEVSANGCIDTSACIEIIDISISESALINTIQLFPNPTDGLVNIQFNSEFKHLKVNVKDVTGSLIQKQTFEKGNELILHLDQPKGVYIIELELSEKQKEIFKIIKN